MLALLQANLYAMALSSTSGYVRRCSAQYRSSSSTSSSRRPAAGQAVEGGSTRTRCNCNQP
jgi:hypothetical protein